MSEQEQAQPLPADLLHRHLFVAAFLFIHQMHLDTALLQ
jgi:hypothetical protein